MGRAKVDGRPGGKKVKDPNKPKRSTSAYFYYLAFCREDAKKHGRSISKIAEFTKEASEKWRNLTSKDKKQFDDKAALDKKRYDREMQSYGGGRGRQPKDPNAPKKPLTGYFLFLADFRESHRGVPNKDLLKMAGEEWRGLDDSEKMPYEKKSQEGQKIYEAKMVEYRKGGSASAPAANGGASAEDEEDDDEEYEDDDE